MPPLKEREYFSDDEDYLSSSDSDSDADSDATNFNSKMLAQPDTIEHNMAQSLQEYDHVMPFDEENQSSITPLPNNDDEKTINSCFDTIKNGARLQTCFHEHTK
eukprot:12961417-Ditylum_brightwellii.AAC.1